MKKTSKKSKSTEKTFMGMPMNWDLRASFKNVWNPDDDQLFPPKGFGIGWGINLHALLRVLGFLEKAKKPKRASKK